MAGSLGSGARRYCWDSRSAMSLTESPGLSVVICNLQTTRVPTPGLMNVTLEAPVWLQAGAVKLLPRDTVSTLPPAALTHGCTGPGQEVVSLAPFSPLDAAAAAFHSVLFLLPALVQRRPGVVPHLQGPHSRISHHSSRWVTRASVLPRGTLLGHERVLGPPTAAAFAVDVAIP